MDSDRGSIRLSGVLLLLSLVAVIFGTCWPSYYSPNLGFLYQKSNSKSPGRSVMAAVRPQFVLLGDSITEQSFRRGGWGAALADTYSRKADVVVRGYGGYNSRWAICLLHSIFPLNCPNVPAVATIFFGANDAAIFGRTSERQHVPVEEYKENLKKIVEHLKKCSPTILVILITPPPVDEDGRKKYAQCLYGEKAMKEPERTNEMTGVYGKQCVELAKELHLPYIDLWSRMQETEGWEKKFLSDGLHLTEEGNSLVHGEVVRVLRKSDFRAEDMKFDFPHHSEIEKDNFDNAFHSFQNYIRS